jgi:hypothetical protein
VICIDDTDGVWWEVEQLVGRHLGKTLFLIHPRYASATENALILGRLSRYFGGKALQAASPRSEDNLGWRRLSGFSAIRAAASPSCKPRPFHASPIFWRCAPSSASGRRR